ncbi:MAG: cytochrome-c peroxidase [Chitinophaga sp.]|nr:cytochrome-c peroxidase [Chitinophaga sp.]PJE46205.1 MAG: cytochrome-c peroxidase [Sediminibacterium sp.] [Sediminibacterium sp. FEMGT703S]
MKKSFILVLFTSVSIIACNKNDQTIVNPTVVTTENPIISAALNLPAVPFDYVNLNLPAYFFVNAGGGAPTSVNGIDNTPQSNPITNNGATLGRVLFYDKNLSVNKTISCASCHNASFGFSDTAILSKGFAGGKTGRHSMSLINAKFYQRGRFFWDERAATLEEQVLMPFQDQTEMGMTIPTLLQRVREQAFYAPLMQNAFGDTIISSNRISLALAQFVRSIVSSTSKYDVGRAQTNNPVANFTNFTAEENEGKRIFINPVQNGGAGCFGCHTTEAFVSANNGPRNNGLDLNTNDDNGAGRGAFKTHTLRNIELTAPYMHDGRFKTLEQVVEHYNSGVKAHPNLDNALRQPNGSPIQLNLTNAQKAALIAFMKTLTDPTIATNTKWSNPFK